MKLGPVEKVSPSSLRSLRTFLRHFGQRNRLASIQKLALAVLLILPAVSFNRAAASVSPTQKTAVLKRLQSIKQTQLEMLTKIDQQLKKRIAESQRISIRSIQVANAKEADRMNDEIQLFSEAIDALRGSREESLARKDLYDQFIFQISTKWDGVSALQGLLQTVSLDMAVVEATSDTKGSNESAKFFSYLSIALREGFDGRSGQPDDVIGFIEDYIDFATVTSPRLPSEFLQQRSYTSGQRSSSARVASTVEAGDHVDRVLNPQLKEVTEPSKPTIDLKKVGRELVQPKPAEQFANQLVNQSTVKSSDQPAISKVNELRMSLKNVNQNGGNDPAAPASAMIEVAPTAAKLEAPAGQGSQLAPTEIQK